MTINITKDIESINVGGVRSLTPRQLKYALITAGIVLPIKISKVWHLHWLIIHC